MGTPLLFSSKATCLLLRLAMPMLRDFGTAKWA